MKATLAVLHLMQADGVIGAYAIGGAVGATFYLEPVATLDLDVFVQLRSASASPLLSLSPLYEYLKARGCRVEGEYIVVEGWPVQFLPPASALEEEAVAQAVLFKVEEVPVPVMTSEHLAAIALKTGRAKDFSRLLQFIETGALDQARLDEVLTRHGLQAKWTAFGEKFLRDTP